MDVKAKKIVFVQTINELIKIWKTCKLSNMPYIILGEGSNILFLENYKGVVIINRIKGIKVQEKKKIFGYYMFFQEKNGMT